MGRQEGTATGGAIIDNADDRDDDDYDDESKTLFFC